MPESQDLSKLPPRELEQLIAQAVDSILKRDQERGLTAGSEFIGQTIAGSNPPRQISAENLKADLADHLRSLMNDPRTTGFVRVEGKEVVLFNRPTGTAMILRTEGGPSTAFTSADPKWLEMERDRWAQNLSAGSTLYDQSLNPLLDRKNDSLIVEYGKGGLANVELAHRTRIQDIQTKTDTITGIILPSERETDGPKTQGFYNAKERTYTFYNEQAQTLVAIGYEKNGGRLNYRDAEVKRFTDSDSGVTEFIRRADQSETLNGTIKIEEGGIAAFRPTKPSTPERLSVPSDQSPVVTRLPKLTFGQTLRNPFDTLGTISDPSRLLTTSLPNTRLSPNPFSSFGENTGSVFNARQYDPQRTFERTFGLFDRVEDTENLDPTKTPRNPNRFSQFGAKVDDLVDITLGPRQPFAMPDKPDIFKAGATLDDMIAPTRTRITPEFAINFGEKLAQSGFVQSRPIQWSLSTTSNVLEAGNTIFESRTFKAGKLAWDGFGTIKGLSEITGAGEAVFGKSAEARTFGNGLVNNTGGYGIKALHTADDLFGLVRFVGDTATAMKYTAWAVGWKPSQQIIMETVNSYNTQSENPDQRLKRWTEFTNSLPTTLLIGVIPGNLEKGKANLSRNLTEFMEKYPDARRGDVFKVFWNEHKGVLDELVRDNPNWEYIDQFVRNTPMNDVRQSYAQFAQENSVGYFTQAPLFGDQYKVPEPGLFYLSGDYLNTMPGKVTLDQEAMVNGFTQQYEAYLSQPRLSDFLNQYTLDQNKDTGTLLSVNQQLLLSPKEREEYERVRALERTQDIQAGTQAARTFATEWVDGAQQRLDKLHDGLKTRVEGAIKNFSEGIQVEYQKMLENAKLAATKIEEVDQQIANCTDPAYAESLRQYRQEWVEWGSSKHYEKYVEDSKRDLQQYIQTKVDSYTKDRDAILFGGKNSRGGEEPGLQASLNSFRHSQAPIRPPTFEIKPYVKEQSPSTYQIDALVQQMQTVSQNSEPSVPTQGMIYTATVKGLTPGIPQVDFERGVTINNQSMATVFQQSANPDPANVTLVDPRAPEEPQPNVSSYDNRVNSLYRYAA